jgi:hypothetical protein
MHGGDIIKAPNHLKLDSVFPSGVDDRKGKSNTIQILSMSTVGI